MELSRNLFRPAGIENLKEKMKKINYLLFILVFIGLQSCKGQSSSQKAKLKELSSKENSLILDVRTPEEFAAGHYEKSINIPLSLLSDSIESLQKFDYIITVCRSGGRSEKAKTLLIENGFENVVNGGGWKSFKKIVEK